MGWMGGREAAGYGMHSMTAPRLASLTTKLSPPTVITFSSAFLPRSTVLQTVEPECKIGYAPLATVPYQMVYNINPHSKGEILYQPTRLSPSFL